MGPIDFQYVCSLPPGINTTAKSIGITSYQLSNLFCSQDTLYILQHFLQLLHRRLQHLCTSQSCARAATSPLLAPPVTSFRSCRSKAQACPCSVSRMSQRNAPWLCKSSSPAPAEPWVMSALVRRGCSPPHSAGHDGQPGMPRSPDTGTWERQQQDLLSPHPQDPRLDLPLMALVAFHLLMSIQSDTAQKPKPGAGLPAQHRADTFSFCISNLSSA